MTTLTERLNLTTNSIEAASNAFKLKTLDGADVYANLCLYCAENSISLNDVSDADFDSASETIGNYVQSSQAEHDVIYFWVD